MIAIEIEYKHYITFFAILSRVAVILFMMPSVGVASIAAKFKVVLAAMLSICIFGTIDDASLHNNINSIGTAGIFLHELLCGLLIGGLSMIFTSIIHTSGMIISLQSGFSSASLFDPSSKAQSTVLQVMINLVLSVFIFATDLHILYIQAIVKSYTKIPMLNFSISDYFDYFLRTFSNSWFVSLQISAPFIIASIILMVGAGVLSKLMTKLQIFFLILPCQIALGLVLFFGVIATVCWRFFYCYNDVFEYFL